MWHADNIVQDLKSTRASYFANFSAEDREKYSFTKKELCPKIVCVGGDKNYLVAHVSSWGLSDENCKQACTWLGADRSQSLPVNDKGWITSTHALMFRTDEFRSRNGKPTHVLAYFKKDVWSTTAKVAGVATGVGVLLFGARLLIRYLTPKVFEYLIDLAKRYHKQVLEWAKTWWGTLFGIAATEAFQIALESVMSFFNTEIENAALVLLIILDVLIENMESMHK